MNVFSSVNRSGGTGNSVRHAGWALLLAGMCWLAACAGVTTSDRDIALLSPDAAEAAVAQRSGVLGIGGGSTGVFVDSRSRSAYDEQHLPGAVSLPFSEVTRDHKRLDDYHTLIVYGDDYNDAVAQAMTKRLIELGHDRVYLLRGGLRGWEAAGRTLESE